MKKTTKKDQAAIGYDFSGGVRGKYAKRFAEGTNIVLLDADLADVFPDSKAVNAALRLFVNVAKRSQASR